MADLPSSGQVRRGTAVGRGVLLAAALGSGLTALEVTVVNVALPAISRELAGGLSALQWVEDAYLLTYGALLPLGGALGDRVGRKAILQLGLAIFGLAAIGCTIAPSMPVLIVARAVMGLGAALLTPASLALLRATFPAEEQRPVIGLWTGLSGLGAVVGPILGGVLVQWVSWRLAFAVNVPFVLAAMYAAWRYAPESRDERDRGVDVVGALLVGLCTGGVTFAGIESPNRGVASPLVLGALVLAVLSLAAVVPWERSRRDPIVPREVVRNKAWVGASAATFALYAALGGASFLLVIELQHALGWTPIAAGAALMPITAVMLVGSPLAGRWAASVGDKLPSALGLVVIAAGLVVLSRIGVDSSTGLVLAGVLVVAVGLSLAVAPLTDAAIASVDEAHAGLASGLNSAVARIAMLAAVALLPLAGGLALGEPEAFATGVGRAFVVAAVVCAIGAAIVWGTLPAHDGTDRP